MHDEVVEGVSEDNKSDEFLCTFQRRGFKRFLSPQVLRARIDNHQLMRQKTPLFVVSIHGLDQ